MLEVVKIGDLRGVEMCWRFKHYLLEVVENQGGSNVGAKYVVN